MTTQHPDDSQATPPRKPVTPPPAEQPETASSQSSEGLPDESAASPPAAPPPDQSATPSQAEDEAQSPVSPSGRSASSSLPWQQVERPATDDGQQAAGPTEPSSGSPAPQPNAAPQFQPPQSPAAPRPESGPQTSQPGAVTPVPPAVDDDGQPLEWVTEAEPVTGSGQMPIPRPPVSRAPAGSAYGYPTRYAEAPGTGHFQLALPQLGTIVAGPAAGGMIAGISAILTAFSVGCTAMFDSIMIPVAATVLVIFCIGAAGLLSGVALRQIKRGGGEFRGKGMAIAGMACGGGAFLVLMLMLTIVVFSWR